MGRTNLESWSSLFTMKSLHRHWKIHNIISLKEITGPTAPKLINKTSFITIHLYIFHAQLQSLTQVSSICFGLLLFVLMQVWDFVYNLLDNNNNNKIKYIFLPLNYSSFDIWYLKTLHFNLSLYYWPFILYNSYY